MNLWAQARSATGARHSSDSEPRTTNGTYTQALPGNPAAVELIGVRCNFGRVCAIDGISLTVPAGTVVGLVGPNGAGKTTLIDTICGLVRPAAGTVRVLGEDVAGCGPGLPARIGVLPEETALYD